MIIEVDDALLHIIQGVVTEQIDTELIEVGYRRIKPTEGKK
jgi:hypothetical protein